MQHTQAFDIQPAIKTPQPKPFQSDASCFSPFADQTVDPPRCSRCGQKAIGGTFLDMDSGYPLGQVTGTVEFDCGCAGAKSYAIRTENIDQWQLFRNIRPGVFRVKKKTQLDRMKDLEFR